MGTRIHTQQDQSSMKGVEQSTSFSPFCLWWPACPQGHGAALDSPMSAHGKWGIMFHLLPVGVSRPTFFQWEAFWKFQNQFVPEMKAEICAHLLPSINVYFHNLKNAARVLSLQGFHTVECSLVHSGPMHCFNATSLQFIRKNVSRKHFEHCLPCLKQVASYISWVSAGTDINWLFTGCLRGYSWFLSDVFEVIL